MRICVLFVMLLAGLQFAGTRYIGWGRIKGLDNPEPCDKNLTVALVVSSVASEDGDTRFLEVHWRNAPLQDGDYLAVYDSDPSAGVGLPRALFSMEVTSVAGFVKTDVLSFPTSVNIGFEPKCLGHWVAYVSPGINNAAPPTVLASSCIRTQPTWMYDLKDEIGQYRFRDLFIPGTHDSGAYAEGEGDRITKYIYTQEEDILNQLIFGIRYLDIRVGYYPPRNHTNVTASFLELAEEDEEEEGGFFVNHGIVKIRPLKEVIDDVVQFLSSTNEIVIFDVQEFPAGFDKDGSMDVHVRLMTYLEEQFGKHAANVSMGGGWWDTPLNTFWKAGKRLIIGYDNDEAVEEAQRISEAAGKGRGGSIIWQSTLQKWGDVRSTADLRNYLSSVLNSPPARVWAAMAELTPNTWNIITDNLGGLRNMADMVNRNVTLWFGGTWGLHANIIATDYFRGNDIIEAAIKWNHRRAVWSPECRKW